MTGLLKRPLRRVAFLAGTAAGAGGLLGVSRSVATAAGAMSRAQVQTIQHILDTALTAELLAMTFYYTGLTSHAVMRDHRLAGASADPNNPGLPPGGTPANVADLQACLDAEVKHAQALSGAGANSAYRHVYFPATTFHHLGTTTASTTFLGVMDTLETAFAGAYIAAVSQFLTLGRPDLAGVAAQIMGVEAEHRVLSRVIANVDPANNLTLQSAPFSSVDDAWKALRPYLTGRGFSHGATGAIAVPSAARAAHVVGRYRTRIVTRFL